VNFVVMLAVSALMAVEALLAWRRLRHVGGRALSLALMVGAAEAFCYAAVFSLGHGPGMVHLAAVYAVTGPPMGAFWLVFAVRFAGVRLPLERLLQTILVGTAVGLVVAVAAYPALMYPSDAGLSALSFVHISVRGTGALFTVQLVWFYALMVTGMVLLLAEALRSWRLYRGQVLAVMGGVGGTFALDVAFMAGFQPVTGLHLGLVVLAVAMLPMIWALPRLRTADLFAAWQPHILDEMGDAVLVADGEGRIVNANRAAQRLLATDPRSGAAKTLAECPWSAPASAGSQQPAPESTWGEIPGQTVTLDVDGRTHHFDLRQSALRDRRGRELSRVLVLRDLTDRIETARELDEANDDLRTLVDAGLEFGASLRSEDVLSAVARRMRELAGADECDLYRLEDGRMRALLTAEKGVIDQDCADLAFDVASHPLTGQALTTMQPVCVQDSAEDPRLSAEERADALQFGYRSSVDLPLIAGGTVVGLAVLTDARARGWERLDLLQGLAHNAAQAMVNSRMYAELRQKAEHLALVSEAGSLFSSSLSVDDILLSTCKRLCEMAEAPICSVYVVDGPSLGCRASVCDGEVDRVWMARTFNLEHWHSARIALETRAPVLIESPDDQRLDGAQRASMLERGEVSLLTVPLVARGQAFGAVELADRRSRTASVDEMRTLEAVCNAAALAIRNADMFGRAQESAARLASLLDASRATTSTVVLDRVLPIVAEKTCLAVGSEECIIWEYRKDAGVLAERTYFSSRQRSYAPTDTVRLNEDPMRRAILEGGVIVEELISDERLDPLTRKLMDEWDEKSRLSAPLVFDGEPIGLLVLIETERERRFKTDELELVRALAEQAAVAIQNARQYERLELATSQLASQVELREVLLEMSGTLLATLGHDDVFSRVATLVKRVVDYDCMEIRLVDQEAQQMYCAYASAAEDGYLENWRCSLDEGVSGWVLRHNEAQLVNDMPGDPRVAVVPGTEADPQASIIVPLTVAGEVIGLLALDRTEGRTFEDQELESAKLFANLAAIAIQNARQYEDVRRMHSHNLHTLCTALNAKDYYTLGHTARVAAYLHLLGKELGWSGEAVDRIAEAAYLHDIGKIGIPDRILTKAGKLNQREWELMRQHPVLSADIIRPLYGEDVVAGVRHHHERYDGRGYPDGLAGEQIPLIARAMCIVDSYDAMSFDRPYHRGLSFSDCLAELERCKGSQFDPVLVDAFARVLDGILSVRRRGLAAGAQAAAQIDVAAHAALAEQGCEEDPAYAETVRILRAVREANPGVRYVTTLARRDEGQIVVCDAEEDEAERSHLGDPMASDEELPRVLAGETPDICLVSADQFGVWISAMTPLTLAGGKIVGAVSVDFAAYETAEAGGLRGDATQALTGLLVGASERRSRAETDAATDLLSGLYTHGRLHEGLAGHIARAEAAGEELSLVLCDVDRLADFNALVGHPHGDEALRLIGQLIESASRPTDLCARFGGDEFAVVLSEGGPRALDSAQRFRSAVEAAGIEAGGQRLTVSVGVATYPWDGRDKDALIDRARWAVNLAKRHGRNRCEACEPPGNGSFAKARKQALGYLAMMAELADARMHYEETHSQTVARLATALAVELGLSARQVADVAEAARLRDIGQFGVPDDVLSKPGVLSEEDWASIREHPRAGERLLRHMGFDEVAEAVAHHHERFDGTGYPRALSGPEIPMSARIVAVASAFQALVNRRPYRPERSADQALDEMQRCAGSQFDPEVVAALERVLSHG
jgi:diguanylate cyclase (GGDEF)-like protein/PAS domain S-box-containing protein